VAAPASLVTTLSSPGIASAYLPSRLSIHLRQRPERVFVTTCSCLLVLFTPTSAEAPASLVTVFFSSGITLAYPPSRLSIHLRHRSESDSLRPVPVCWSFAPRPPRRIRRLFLQLSSCRVMLMPPVSQLTFRSVLRAFSLRPALVCWCFALRPPRRIRRLLSSLYPLGVLFWHISRLPTHLRYRRRTVLITASPCLLLLRILPSAEDPASPVAALSF